MLTTPRLLVLSCFLAVTCLGCSGDEPAPADRPESEVSNGDQKAAADSPEPEDDAFAIIDAAIAAHGGEANLAKADVGRTTMLIDGTLQPGISGNFKKVETFQLPGRMRRHVEGRVQGQDVTLDYISCGDEGWMQLNGGEPRNAPAINDMTPVFPSGIVKAILLLKSGDFQLSVEPKKQLKDQPAIGIRMDVDGEWAETIYYHQKTKLVVATFKSLEDAAGQSHTVETYYSNYRNVDGLNIPMSMDTVTDGEATMKVTVTEVTFLETIAPTVFTKPVAAQ